MVKLALPLALVSLAAAGWMAFEMNALKDEVHALQAAAPPAASGALSHPVSDGAALPPVRVQPATDTSPVSVSSSAVVPGSAPTLSGSATEPPALAQRLSALEERVKAQEAAAANRREVPHQTSFIPGGRRFLGDVETAARDLKLDDRQKDELERIVDASRRELDRLHSIPNDEGVTWKDATSIKIENAGDGDGVIAFALGNLQKAEAFKKTKVPGTNETFGEAESRIRRQSRENARRILTPEQQKTWDDSITDPLFGGSGNTFVSSVQMVVDDGSDDEAK